MKLELRRNQMKYFSEDNMRKIISLTISLANKVDATAEKCINPFTPNTAYTKGSFVTYNNYIYEAKYACNDPDFVESHWVKLSDEINEIDLDTVKSYLGLTQDKLDTLASIISTEVRLDKCFSSSDTYMRIQDALKEAKQYCITELAKKSTGSFKKANDVSEVTDGNYLYLIYNSGTSKYDIYALVDSNVELLTSVDVNLDDYFTKQEITDSYYDKATSDGKFATITTVDGKMDKTDILTAKDNSATDDQVYSAKVMNTELDGVVKKTDIATTIDSTSTDDTVPTNKAVYDSLINKVNNPIVITTADEVNSFDRVYQSFIINPSVAEAVGLPKAPDSTWFCINLSHFKGFKYPSQIAFEYAGIERIMYRTAHNGVWHNWRKIPNTSVADVPVTTITNTLVSTKVALDNSDSYATYYVKSGTCYVTIWSLRLIEACSVETIFNGLPKSTIGVTCPLCNGVESFAQVFMSPNSGVIAFNANASLVNKSGYCSFSYPVAES